MYSPFPGMDPYLERGDRWSGVHAGMIAVIRESLSRQLAPDFFVDSEDNVYILDAADPARVVVRPDLYLVGAGHDETHPAARGHASAALLLDLPVELEIRAPYLRIVDTTNRRYPFCPRVTSPGSALVLTPGNNYGHAENCCALMRGAVEPRGGDT